jgi:hypothetical protein
MPRSTITVLLRTHDWECKHRHASLAVMQTLRDVVKHKVGHCAA